MGRVREYNLSGGAERQYLSEKNIKICPVCGKEFISNHGNEKYCCIICREQATAIKRNQKRRLIPEEQVKVCPVCGKTFTTTNSNKITCSTECSKTRKNSPRFYSLERKEKQKESSNRWHKERWRREHPGARTKEEIHAEAEFKKQEKEKRKIERESEWARKRAEKEQIKKENIAHWLEYEAEHTCCICGKTFIAHYPTAKYCSKKCQKDIRHKKRYKGITIDKGISLKKLALRDNCKCQLCGMPVDWNDYIKTGETIVCGDMYPSIDHIKPISLGGLHSWDNIQLAHRKCNSQKSNTFIHNNEFAI